MAHKFLNKVIIVMVFIVISVLNFGVPYYGQQSVDEYKVIPQNLSSAKGISSPDKTAVPDEPSVAEEIKHFTTPMPPSIEAQNVHLGQENISEEGRQDQEGKSFEEEQKTENSTEVDKEAENPEREALEKENPSIDQHWIESMLKEYEDEIDQQDVADFRRIIGKLDLNYVTEVLENPGGEAGEVLLKQYLRSRLSEAEYERSKELFFQYNYILLK